MNTQTNNLSFNGTFKVKKVPPRKRKAIEDLIAKKDAFIVDGSKEDKSMFVVVKPYLDNKLFETLKNLNLGYSYYPQVQPGMKDINTNTKLNDKINNLVANETTIKNIMKLLKIDMPKYIPNEEKNGIIRRTNSINGDTLLISPINKNGTNFVEFYKGLSMSDMAPTRRYSINGSKILHEYNPWEELGEFKNKINQTLFIHRN